MIIVGRTALKFWTGKDTLDSDMDVWLTLKEGQPLPKGKGLDYVDMPKHIMDEFTSNSRGLGHATLKDLLAIKLSHLGYDVFWQKHKQDVLYLSKLTRGQYNANLYSALVKHWEETKGDKKHLSLHKTKKDFFDDHVKKYFEHDYLHELVAKDGVPVYTLCLKDNQEVLIDKSKWDVLSFRQQVRMFQEEIAVIALERWIIPSIMNGKDMPISVAWGKSLHKTIVALTKNWATEFIVLNLEEFLKPLDQDILRALDKLNLKEKYMSNQMTLENFKDILQDHLIKGVDSFDSDEFIELLYGWITPFEGVEVIEQEGGGEGGGEDCYTVLKVGGVFYKITYSYYSHYGVDLDYASVYIVTPQEKTITVYE